MNYANGQKPLPIAEANTIKAFRLKQHDPMQHRNRSTEYFIKVNFLSPVIES